MKLRNIVKIILFLHRYRLHYIKPLRYFIIYILNSSYNIKVMYRTKEQLLNRIYQLLDKLYSVENKLSATERELAKLKSA